MSSLPWENVFVIDVPDGTVKIMSKDFLDKGEHLI